MPGGIQNPPAFPFYPTLPELVEKINIIAVATMRNI
jgi:hypothetical protein